MKYLPIVLAGLVLNTLTFAQNSQVQRTDFETGDRPNALDVGDLNQDGYPDIVVACQRDNSLRINFSNGSSFSEEKILSSDPNPMDVVIADFDNDGDLDIASVSYKKSRISIYLNEKNGRFKAPKYFSTGNWPIALATADFNGDGNLDLVTANSLSDNVSILKGEGDGTFAPMTTHVVGWQPIAVVPADIDSDGDMDILTVNQGDSSFSILINHENGVFTWSTSFKLGVTPYDLIAGEFTGDNKQDVAIVAFNQKSLYLYSNFNDGNFEEKLETHLDFFPASLAAFDLDLDGDLDIVTRNNGAQISSILNDGHGGFSLSDHFATQGYSSALQIVDLNVDGRPEVIVTNSLSNSFSVFDLHPAQRP